MTHFNPYLKTNILAAAIALAAPLAFAQSFDAVRLNAAAPGKDGGTAVAAVIAAYEYQGSDQQRTLFLPVLNYQWANGWFAGVTNGIGYNFSSSPQMQYGLRLTANQGREESRANTLRGMGNVDAAAEGGAFLNYSLSQGMVLTSSIRFGAGAHSNGLVVDLGAGYATAVAPNWYLSAGAGITLVNADYMQSFFGVTGDQSAASGHRVYTPGAGVRDLRASMALTYSIDQRTSVTTALSSSSLLGDAQDSPITHKRTSVTGVVAITYAF
jgi:outer membrane scaffolding protein for murein synthesis (MipA/OmpV family)